MRVVVAAVGRCKAGPEKALFEHYARRITFPFELKEVEEKRPLKLPKLLRREAELLLAQVPDGAKLLALDRSGREMSSEALAEALGTWRDDGVRDVVFAVGGADGLDPVVRERADHVVSLGAMTWPHLLVRGMLAEQIYRAQCILAGHPYHRA